MRAPQNLTSERFMELMAVDKKVLDGKLRLVLMKGLGESVISGEASAAAITAVLDTHLKGA